MLPLGDAVLEMSVGEFSRRFAKMIAGHPKLQRIAIVGEITDIKRWRDGNLNMSLKEGEAVLGCFSFASEVRRFPVLKEGLTVRAEGSIEIRPNRSQYQLRALVVSLVGEGKLAAEIEELRMRLRAEGVFDASRKRAVPLFPRRVALVTSDDDARADFEVRLRADAPHVEVLFFRTRVQGKGAEIEVAEAMDRASRAKADVVVLTRGGGSSDDRLTFNLEPVVRAILRSPHPVITALGHTKNRHLADEVADLSLATPTAAAVHLGKEWSRAFEVQERLRSALMRGYRSVLAGKTQSLRFADVALDHRARGYMSRRLEQLHSLERLLGQRSPAQRVAQWRLRLVQASNGLTRASERLQQQWARRLERAQALLVAEDPTRPLARGFAIVTKDGVAVHDAVALAVGDVVSARLERGTFAARVESVHAE
ncbi:MAG TPA: exodeoxyribonuclease VII large subunit [Candidatus Cybelea sp.]|jgi:exodeoxyribonuclease VII large subunit|nr:exodeoxyribonuclease VII large subunit [Candidatus Cybelea sp.]